MVFDESDSNEQSLDLIQPVKTIFFTFTILFYVLIVWSSIGFVAFIVSIVCFFKNERIGLNILGLFLSLILGPFYFLFLLLAKPYCRSEVTDI